MRRCLCARRLALTYPFFVIAIHRATAAHLTCCVLPTRRQSVDSLQEVGSCRVGGKVCRTSGWQSCVRLAAGNPGTSSLKTQPSARPLPARPSPRWKHIDARPCPLLALRNIHCESLLFQMGSYKACLRLQDFFLSCVDRPPELAVLHAVMNVLLQRAR